jgi:hypothetical protein
MEDGKTPSSFSISNILMCQEDSTDLDFSIESESHRKTSISSLENESFSETEEKYIERLVSKEMSFCTMYRAGSSSCYEDYSSVFVDDWFKSVRFDAVQWILRVSSFIEQFFREKEVIFILIIIKCIYNMLLAYISPLLWIVRQASILGWAFKHPTWQ